MFGLGSQEAQLIDSLHEAVFSEAIEWKWNGGAICQGQNLPGDVNRKFYTLIVEQPLMRFGIDGNCQQSIFERVVAKNIGNLSGYDSLEAIIK